MKRHGSFGSLSLIVMCVLWMAFLKTTAGANTPETSIFSASTADHSRFKVMQQNFQTGPEVTRACLTCHTEAAKQVQQSIHWTWTFEDDEKKLGKRFVLNNF